MAHVYEVNAFTAAGSGGNPAGVVLHAEHIDPIEMLAIAQLGGYSETAFVSNSSLADRKIRFFTTTEEVDLCGHATIATWSLLFESGVIRQGSYTQETMAGVLKVEAGEDGTVYMQQKKPAFGEAIDAEELERALGIEFGTVSGQLEPRVVSTGLRDIMVPLKRPETLERLRPNMAAIRQLSERHLVTGLHVFSLLSDGNALAAARNFSPLVGVPEESATGTANGALLCYLQERRLISAQQTYLVEQGRAMGLLSHVYGKFVADRVWIGGRARLLNEFDTP